MGTIRSAILFIVIGLAVVSFGACGKHVSIEEDMTPSQTVEAFLDSFKAQEWENMDLIYAGESSKFTEAYKPDKDDDELTKALKDTMMSKLYDFDYTIDGEEISEDGKTADVDITVTTYDMVTVFNEFYQEYMEWALDEYSGRSSEMTDEAMQKMAVETLQEKVDQAKKDYESTAVLTLTMKDGRWIVDEINESNPDFLNAISGGMMDVASDVINSRSDDGGDTGDDKSDE